MQSQPTELQQVLESIKEVETRLENKFSELKSDVEIFNMKFDNYQKATQSIVNLSFGLIASATIISIVSHIFPR